MLINQYSKYFSIIVTSIMVALIAMPLQAANWTLDKTQSTISFVSIKKDSIAESHIFTEFSGDIKGSIATISINPVSVDTKVAIRDERLSKFLFETNIFPEIIINASVESVLAKTDKSNSTSIPATLSLHGVKKNDVGCYHHK